MMEVDGEIALTPLAPVSDDASLPLRLAATAAGLDRPIAKGSLTAWPTACRRPATRGRTRRARRSSRCSASGRPAIDKIESLDQHGLLVRLIPEWAAVRNKPQRNAYHTFTVDRHLLEAAALAAELTDRVERPDLLLVGALLHDIGKGFPGDHTEVGMEVVERIATRMGFPPADVDVLVDLVRHHLLLPDTATRRDLDDPTTIARVARAAGNRLTLHLLAALTEADSRATGPSAWGAWKAGLVADLVERTDRVLQGEAEPAGPDRILAANRELMDEVRQPGCRRSRSSRPGSSLRRRTGAACSPRWPGRWPSTAWTCGPPTSSGEDGRRRRGVHRRGGPGDLARHGQAARGPGRRALRPHGHRRAPLRAGADLPPPAAALRPTCPGSDVSVDNEASETATVLEVRAPDEIGLLHRITRALFEADLDVVSARVSTLGEMVVDAFYVRESDGAKVTDAGRLSADHGSNRGRIWAFRPCVSR